MALKKSELYSSLWSSCDELRGGMEASQYKDWSVVKNYEVPLPAMEEQFAIASILSDMDAEIAALEAKLAKARCLKQGMMQELLTGRIRLI